MPTTFANGRSIVHAGDGQVDTAAPPDVCKTPSPAGPVPVPYVNIAKSSDLANGTKSVKIEGNSVAVESSNLSTSTGDEPGSAGGIISAKNKGKLTWQTRSLDVKFEGKGVVRFGDVTLHNGNSFNTALKQNGRTGLAYGDDFQGPCPICRKGPKEHRIHETKSSAQLCSDIISALHAAYADATNTQKRKIGNNGRGFMVGVMVCKHEPCRTFAARSGFSTPQFKSIAGTFVDEVIPGGPVSRDEFISANTSGIAASRVARAMDKALKEMQDAFFLEVPGFNPPGVCAASKLLARSGHAPVEMTERFFKPEGTWSSPPYPVLSNTTQPAPAWLKAVLDNGLSRRQSREFSLGESVASCQSCQRISPLTMCPLRVCK